MAYERLNKVLKDKKGQFQPSTWIIAFIIFTGVFALLFASSTDLINKYDKSNIVEDEYNNSYNKFNEVMNPPDEDSNYRGLFQDLTNSESGMLEIIFGDAGIFKGLFTLVKLTFASVGTLDDMTTDFVSDFGVPEGIANIIFPLASAILSILLIFAVISSVNRGGRL